MLKKIVSLFLVVAFLAVPVYAGDGAGYEDYEEYTEIPETLEDEHFLAYRTAETFAEGLGISEDAYIAMSEKFFAAAKNYESECDISEFAVPYNGNASSSLLVKMMFKDNPEVFHLESYIFGNMKKINGTFYYTTIKNLTYRYERSEYEAMIAEVHSAAEYMLRDIRGNDSLTDVQKALLLHDRLAANCEYDYENLANNTVPAESYTLYGALVKKICVCEGYSKAYSYLLDQVGIENYLCDSSELVHMWNIIYIDGEKYHVDVTFDDPYYDVTGRVLHDYFLCSTEKLKSDYEDDENPGHYAFDYDETPTSTVYDGAFWDCSETEFVFCKGDIYYVRSSDNTLYRWTENGEVPVKFLDGTWYTSSSSYYIAKYSKICSDGEYIFYSLPREVRRYDPVTGEDTLVYTYVPDAANPYFSIFGMHAERGDMKLDVFNSPNYDTEIKETYGVEVDCRTVPSLGHDPLPPVLENAVEATCTAHGNYDVVTYCSRCGAEVSRDNVTTDPLGHDFSVFVTSVPADCVNEGYDIYQCPRCRNVELRYNATPLGHDPLPPVEENVVEASCISSGSYDLVTYCSKCGAEISRVYMTTEPVDHNYTEYVIAPTCTEGGYTFHLCLKCGAGFYSDETEPVGHDWGEWTVLYAPGCTEPGADYRVCRNDTTHTDVKTVPATGHDYVGVETAPTCTEEGYTTYTCSRCGGTYVGDEKEPLGHEFVAGERYCTHGCGAENPDFSSGYKVICDGVEFGTYSAGETVTLPVPTVWKNNVGGTFRFFTWAGASVARSKYNKNNNTANGRTYTLTVPEGDVTLTPVYSYVGDANGDNRINSKDLIEIKKILAGNILPDDAKNDRSDLDCNGRVESRDVASLKKLFASNYDIIR